MTGVKVYASISIIGWFAGTSGALAQVALGPDSLIPLGVAVLCLSAALGAAVKVTQWVDRIEHRIKSLEAEEMEEE